MSGAKSTTAIHFVTWPDGKIFEGSQTSIDPDIAVGCAIRTWLPAQWFPGIDVRRWTMCGRELWRAMEKAGSKVHTIALPVDVADGVSQ